jgi:N-acetylglucosamine-6-phosphate deacetylase
MIIEDGIAKMPHRQCFAGSLATADRLIRTMRPIAGLENAVKMLTEIPAISHSLNGKGRLSEGYDADIVIFDEDVNIEKIIIKNNNGVKIYN